jgi:hypothetical protein
VAQGIFHMVDSGLLDGKHSINSGRHGGQLDT